METRVECALKTCFFDGCFATDWGVKVKGSWWVHCWWPTWRKIHVPGNCFLSPRWQILGWVCHNVDIFLFYRPFSGSELLSYGNSAWFGYLFRPLTTIGKVSRQCMTSQAAQNRLHVCSVALRQRLASEYFMPHCFRIGVAISMALMGLHLHEIMDLVGRKEVT